MFGIENVASFLWASTLVIVVPGPASLFVAGKALKSASGAAWATAGIMMGDLVLISLAGFGFAAVLKLWPWLLSALKFAGAIYLAYLGIGLLGTGPAAQAAAAPVREPERAGLMRGLLLTLTNPKPILFFGAFFPMFIEQAASSWMQSFYALGALFELLNVGYFAVLIGLSSRLRSAGAYSRLSGTGLRRLSGVGLLSCASAMLATALG